MRTLPPKLQFAAILPGKDSFRRDSAAPGDPQQAPPFTSAVHRNTSLPTEIVLVIIPVPYMRSATRWTCPTLRNVGYCPIVTRAASREDIPGSVRRTVRTVPSWAVLAVAALSADRKPATAAA